MAAKVNSSYLSTQMMDLDIDCSVPTIHKFIPYILNTQSRICAAGSTELLTFIKTQTRTHMGPFYLQNI